MTIDALSIIIVSDAKLNHKVTLDCINTLLGQKIHEIIVVESEPSVVYVGTRTVYPPKDWEFNYNKYLNFGASFATGYYIAFCNNDLIFNNGWWESLYLNMKKYNVSSGSPICPSSHKEFGFNRGDFVHKGIDIRKYVAGWCIVLDRLWYLRMGKFDERFKFWCADNSYGEQLKKYNESHILDCNSVVNHVQSATLMKLDDETKHEYTMKEVEKFNSTFGKNLFNMKKNG